ncbi:MAG: hypothetical protein ABI415_07685 [Flavitalea sp.]
MTTPYLYPVNFINRKIGKRSDITSIATERKLNLSIHEKIGDYVVAIDHHRNILLHLNAGWKKSKLLVVDLKEVMSCAVIKQYTNIEAGGFRKNGLAYYITKMFLHLRFYSTGSLSLPIYNYSNRNKNIKHIKNLEEKTERWKSIVSGQLIIRLS